MQDVAARFAEARLRRAGERFLRSCEHNYAKHGVRELLWEAQEGRCICCGERMVSRYRFPNSGDRDTIDHIRPLGAGGADAVGNLALMRHVCNARKASKFPGRLLLNRLWQINERLGWPQRNRDLHPDKGYNGKTRTF